jgi:hypothetical protein
MRRFDTEVSEISESSTCPETFRESNRGHAIRAEFQLRLRSRFADVKAGNVHQWSFRHTQKQDINDARLNPCIRRHDVTAR